MRQHTTGRAAVKFFSARIAEYEDCLADAVCASRQAGATWEQIGQVLGISAQAAHSRYRKVVEERLAEGGPKATVARW